MNLMDTIIETKNLLLKPIETIYAQEIFNEFNNELTLYMFPAPSESIDGVHDFITFSLDGLRNNSNLQLVVIDKVSKEFLGCSGLHKLDVKTPELGIWIKISAHGNGYGLEAISAIINWAKANVDFDYLKYPVDRRNIASRRIPEKNGGIIKDEYKCINQKGSELDLVEYRIY